MPMDVEKSTDIARRRDRGAEGKKHKNDGTKKGKSTHLPVLPPAAAAAILPLLRPNVPAEPGGVRGEAEVDAVENAISVRGRTTEVDEAGEVDADADADPGTTDTNGGRAARGAVGCGGSGRRRSA